MKFTIYVASHSQEALSGMSEVLREALAIGQADEPRLVQIELRQLYESLAERIDIARTTEEKETLILVHDGKWHNLDSIVITKLLYSMPQALRFCVVVPRHAEVSPAFHGVFSRLTESVENMRYVQPSWTTEGIGRLARSLLK